MLLKSVVVLFFLGLLFPQEIFSQKLYLSTNGETEEASKIIDSLYYQKNFDDFGSLQNEVSSIKKRLINQGFIEIELLILKQQNDSVYLASYQLNRRYKTIRLYFNGAINKIILKSAFLNENETYVDVEIGQLEQTLKTLNTEFSNQGDPFSTLQLSNLKKRDADHLYADLIISAKKQSRTIDSIIIKGYEKFPKSFITRFLRIKRNQNFNLNTIKKKMAELDNLVFANQLKEPEVLFTKDSTLLYIYLEKQKSNAFDGFLGFGTNEKSSKIQFNGYLNLNLTNNLDYGESFKLQYKSDESEQKTLDFKTRLPYLFQSPLGVEVGLNIFKKDSTFNTVSQFAKIDYQFNARNMVSVGITSINSTNLLSVNSFLIDDYKSIFYTADYSYIKRQPYDLLFPINFEFSFMTGFGNRLFDTVKASQKKFALNAAKIFNLNDANSIYIKINGGTIISNDYFDNELLRFGGINSIRGFKENSLTANLFTLINTEYRYKLSNSLYVHTIIDAGYFENNIISAKEKIYGVGLGFGLVTKAGLFRFNYSNGKSENQSFKFSDSKIHLSLTASF